MSRFNISVSALALGATLLGATLPAGAQATHQFAFSNDLSGSQVAQVSGDGGAHYDYVYSGRYASALDGGPTINIFCVDYNHEIHLGDTYTADTSHLITDAAGPKQGAYYNGGLASAFNTSDYGLTLTGTQRTARAAQVAFLADRYLNSTVADFSAGLSGSTSFNDNLTGVSLSIWDIVQDGGDGLGAGSLRGGTDTSTAFGGLVQYYESQALANVHYTSQTAGWIQAPLTGSYDHMQDYVYERTSSSNAAVPEPSSYMSLGLGALGLLGLCARRRKSR